MVVAVAALSSAPKIAGEDTGATANLVRGSIIRPMTAASC